MPWPTNRRVIGTKVQRLDGPAKATGRAKYSFDINRPGMLHAKILRSPHARARLVRIDTSNCEKTPGFRAFHLLVKPNEILYFAGAEIIAVAADTEEHADDCLRALQAAVEYEALSHHVKEAQSLEANENTTGGARPNNVGPPATSESAKFADVAYQNVAATHEGRYSVPVISHQCLESHGLVAEWDADLANLTVYASTQAVPITAGALAMALGLPAGRVKCITHYM